MAFKMKFSGGTPFHFHGGDPGEHVNSSGEIDPQKLKYKTTETATNLAGQQVDTAGTATVTVPGQKVERFAQPGTPEYAEWEAAVKANPSIEDKYKDKEVNVTRKRKYSTESSSEPETMYDNPFKNFSYRRYKKDQNKRLTAAQQSGKQLSSRQIIDLAKDVYGDGWTKDPYMASWMQKNKLRYNPKGKQPKKSTQPENLGDYSYEVNE